MSFGLGKTSSMSNAEIVAFTVVDNELLVYEYEGRFFNFKPTIKKDPGSWLLENSSINGANRTVTAGFEKGTIHYSFPDPFLFCPLSFTCEGREQ
jgi:hypothetical protein